MKVSESKVLGNLFSLYRALGNNLDSIDIAAHDGFEIVYARGAAWPNMAFNIEENAISKDLLESVAAEMVSFGVRPSMIVHHSLALPGVLKPYGFFPVDQWTGMRYLLSSIERDQRDKPSACFSIDDGKGLKDWMAVVSGTLFDNNHLDIGAFEWLRSGGADIVGLKVENELVGSSMIYYDQDGTPGIYMVGIKKEYRGKGLGREIVNFCLLKIKDAGADTCYLQATRAGLGMYKAMGFEELDKYLICCKIK